MCRYRRYVQVFLQQYDIHTHTYWHIPAHSAYLHIVTDTEYQWKSLSCRYFFQIPTDMAPTFWHTYTYLPTGSLMLLLFMLCSMRSWKLVMPDIASWCQSCVPEWKYETICKKICRIWKKICSNMQKCTENMQNMEKNMQQYTEYAEVIMVSRHILHILHIAICSICRIYTLHYYLAYYFAYWAYFFAYFCILLCIFCIFCILQYAQYAEYTPCTII